MVVRDEEDIVRSSVELVLRWADTVAIFDTGSVDSTTEIVREMARNRRRVLFLGREEVRFSQSTVRPYVFKLARKEFEAGDWVVLCDADEFWLVAPQVVLARRDFSWYNSLFIQHYNVLYERDVWEQREHIERFWPESLEELSPLCVEIEKSEPRVFRYRSKMKWPSGANRPRFPGFPYRGRIPVLHFKYRSRRQYQKRRILRSEMYETAAKKNEMPDGHHWAVDGENPVTSEGDTRTVENYKIETLKHSDGSVRGKSDLATLAKSCFYAAGGAYLGDLLVGGTVDEPEAVSEDRQNRIRLQYRSLGDRVE